MEKKKDEKKKDKKKKKSGAESAKIRDKKLREAAGKKREQKSLHDCLTKRDESDNSTTIDSRNYTASTSISSIEINSKSNHDSSPRNIATASKTPIQKSLNDFLKKAIHVEVEVSDDSLSLPCLSSMQITSTLSYESDSPIKDRLRKTAGKLSHKNPLPDHPTKSQHFEVNDSESNDSADQSYTFFKNDVRAATPADEVHDQITEQNKAFNETPIEFRIPEHNSVSKVEFVKLHPIHPASCKLSTLFEKKIGNAVVKRNWLSYNTSNGKFYCSICMAFSDIDSPYKSGVVLISKHATHQIVKHETSNSHILAANIYMQLDTYSSKTVDSLLNNEQHMLRLSNIKKNQQVIKRIIEWILCFGRQGIAYRGSDESLKYFSDVSTNHGNFLEILRTASLHDSLLQSHLDKCIEAANKAANFEEKGPRGRGSTLTFLSKTTVNKLIKIIGDEIRKVICMEVKKAGIFSIMCDSSKDIVGHEQCAISLRYINFETFSVEERFLGVVRLHTATGEGCYDAIITFLRDFGIDTSLMVGCSFDGASNMRSEILGLQTRLKELNKDLVYTWCYAHLLNLVVSDCSGSGSSARNLFGLLQTTHTFCSASYKRVGEWEKLAANLRGRQKLIRLESFGKTRWYSKEKALSKLFGSFGEPSTEVYMTLLEFLKTIKNSPKFDPQVSLEAGFLLESWTKIDTIMTAFTFMKIFEIIGPTSKYFQTQGLDLFAAWSMLQSSISKIEKVRNSFEDVKSQAVSFIKKVNEATSLAKDINEDNVREMFEDVFVGEEFPAKRVRRVKRMPGEKAVDEPIEDQWDSYRINQFIVAVDVITQGLKIRYNDNENKDLLNDMKFFDPRNFENLSDDNISLPFVSRVLEIDESSLINELKDFAETYNRMTPSKNKPVENLISDSENDAEDEMQSNRCKRNSRTTTKSCNNCMKCCFSFLLNYNFHLSSYTNVFRAYEYFLTLPCTQVECERAFSKMKIIKSRLRSALKQDLLHALMLMNIERELTFKIDTDRILSLFASSSTELSRSLIE